MIVVAYGLDTYMCVAGSKAQMEAVCQARHFGESPATVATSWPPRDGGRFVRGSPCPAGRSRPDRMASGEGPQRRRAPARQPL
jgi:hypothetical protein